MKEVDTRFKVDVLSKTPNPQRLVWLAAHQDYSEEFVGDYKDDNGVGDGIYGDRIVKHLLGGNRGHYGPLEHPQITFACGFFPHDTIMQARTHRVGVSFDVQSQRYTGKRVLEVANGTRPIEDVFYQVPHNDALRAAVNYKVDLDNGAKEEDARRCLPQGIRQHFVVSFNCRSLMHFFDLRSKEDAQWEIQILCDKMLEHAIDWAPQIFEWYESKRWSKAKLSP